ncbi:MAG: lipid kinase [Bdellovibrionota bacterium]
MKNILLLINPSSRQGAQTKQEVEAFLKENNYSLIDTSKDQNKEFSEIIRIYKDKTDVVVVGGGDGSVNAALSGLIESQLPLMVIPLGTANNLARTLQIPKEPSKALKLLDTGVERRIDVGVVNDLFFVNVAGIGLSTKINQMVPPELKKKLGVLAFILMAFKFIRRLTPFHYKIEHEGKVTEGKSWQISVCNGRHYGSGLVSSEDAALNDNQLDCISTEMKRWWEGIFLIPALITGKNKEKKEITLIQTTELKLTTHRPRHIDVDGDIKTQTPAIFKIQRKAVRVITPPVHGKQIGTDTTT